MTTRTKVTIFNVDQNVDKANKAGKPYKATIVSAKTNEGRAKDFLIMQTTVNRSPDMQTQLSSLVMGDTATIVEEPRAGSTFTDIVGVHKGDVPNAGSQIVPFGAAQPQSKAAGYAGTSSSFDSSGVQVGNALNNACLMLANKVMKGGIESVAEEILRISERLKSKLKAGNYNEPPALVQQKVETITTYVEDDDIPFEDM